MPETTRTHLFTAVSADEWNTVGVDAQATSSAFVLSWFAARCIGAKYSIVTRFPAFSLHNDLRTSFIYPNIRRKSDTLALLRFPQGNNVIASWKLIVVTNRMPSDAVAYPVFLHKKRKRKESVLFVRLCWRETRTHGNQPNTFWTG